MAAPNPEQMLFQAYRLEQLGLLENALAAYRQALQALPNNPMANIRHFRLARDLNPRPVGAIKLVWQVAPEQLWESEWVRYLLSALSFTEIVDGHHREFHDGAIIVDNQLKPPKTQYYFEMLRRGHRFGLIHISDEHYLDDCTPYEFANFAVRHYWSAVHAANRRVMAVPLGTLNGFRAEPSKPSSGRERLWCFAGEINKSTRKDMLDALGSLEGGFVHPTGASSVAPVATPPLGIADYARLLSDSIFAPCPSGWENLDSFRVFEALEAGCIPIVERRPSYDYFRSLLGEHPMITVDRWTDAPAAIKALQDDPAKLEARRVACADWWQSTKRDLVSRVRDHCMAGFDGATAGTSAAAG